MEKQQSNQPIIIKRKKSGHGGHHGGAWKVAFADFMTAMMAFFLVMWLVNQSDPVKQAVAAYFRDPGKFQKEGSMGVLKGSKGIIEQPNQTIQPANPQEKIVITAPSEAERNELSLAGQKILEQLERHEVFKKLRKNVKVELTAEGLRIILNESADSPAFFEPGSAKLLQKSAIILITIARELGKLENKIVLEGHTDASFSGSRAYTNWELSADRANAARALMEVSGLQQEQVREVRGYADRFPMISHDPGDHRNRRVTILVLYESTEKQYDHMVLDDADLSGPSDK